MPSDKFRYCVGLVQITVAGGFMSVVTMSYSEGSVSQSSYVSSIFYILSPPSSMTVHDPEKMSHLS